MAVRWTMRISNQKSGIAYVKSIPLVPAEDLFEALCRTAITFDLGETGDTGFHQIAKFIRSYHAGKAMAIIVHMRPGTDDAHMTR